MGKHFLANRYISKLNELTESEVTELTSSMVDETALAILLRQGSRGITIVSLLSKVIFDIPLNPYWLKWLRKCSNLAAENVEISEIKQHKWKRNVILGFVLAQIPCNAASNLELRWSCTALQSDLVLPSVIALSNICRREYAMSVDAITKQLPSQNNVSVACDGCTSTNKRAIMSVITYYMDWNWALHKVQCTFVEVDHLCFSGFEW